MCTGASLAGMWRGELTFMALMEGNAGCHPSLSKAPASRFIYGAFVKAPKLTIELVPRSAWFKNLRSMIPPEQWDSLRRGTYRRVGYKCEICGGVGPRHPVECHEKWEYDDANHIANLVGLYGLCPACHEVKHIGLAQINGRLPQAIVHLAAINGLTERQSRGMVKEAFEVWERRSQHGWTVNIDWARNKLMVP